MSAAYRRTRERTDAAAAAGEAEVAVVKEGSRAATARACEVDSKHAGKC